MAYINKEAEKLKIWF